MNPRRPALSVWVTDGDEDVLGDTLAQVESDVYSTARGVVHLESAINETVALQLVLRSTDLPDGPFDVDVSDLEAPTGTLAADAIVTRYRAQYVRVDKFASWYPQHTSRPITPTLFPDELVPWDAPRGGGPLTLAEPRNEIVWIDLHVPPTAAPGLYRGVLRVTRRQSPTTRDVTLGLARPAEVFRATVELEVRPVALPTPRSLPVVCRVDPRDLLATHLRWPPAPAELTRLVPGEPSHEPAIELVDAAMQLFQSHRLNPILWASFPRFVPRDARRVEVRWQEYDALVSGWLDGSAFDDRIPLDVWAIPASIDYPSAVQNGGLASPQYANLLPAYLAACSAHFEQRGWLGRALLRMAPPEPLSPAAVDRARTLDQLVRRSETNLRSLVHLPPRSLRGLGWHDAPAIDGLEPDVWAPTAMWFEPPEMARQRALHRDAWFMPDQPPYCGSLAPEAPAADTRVIPWLAYRYGAGGIWIEHAAEFVAPPPRRSDQPWNGPGLLYPGNVRGIVDAPLPSMRLKRLRRGLQDFELLKLLEANGQKLLAQRLAEQMVRWAFTDAARDNLLSTKPAGWPSQSAALRLARSVMLGELTAQFAPSPAARQQQIHTLSSWSLLFNQAERVAASVDGARLRPADNAWQADVVVSVANTTNRAVDGQWRLADPLPGWSQPDPLRLEVPPGAQRSARFTLGITDLPAALDGALPFDMTFDTPAFGAFAQPARLAVAACPELQRAPTIDARLDDWPIAAANVAGGLQLVRSERDDARKSTLPTQAFFGVDRQYFYVAVRCGLRYGEPPLWLGDNVFPMDGATPWEQDVIELLIDPRPQTDGTSGDVYCLRIKPSGLMAACKGVPTEPPIGPSAVWNCNARVAARIEPDVWITEVAIPLDAFDAAARRASVWGFNLTRLDARHGEYASWSGAHGYCYAPRSLGNLVMLWGR